MKKDILRLRAEFIPSKYGMPSIFDNITYSTSEGIFYYKHEIKPISQEYDCLTACLYLRRRLQEMNIKCKLCAGTDKLNIFKNHTFIELEDGTLLDPVPVYDFVNPKHTKKEYICEEIVARYDSEKSSGGQLGIFPLRFERPSFLSLLGIEYLHKLGPSKLRKPTPMIQYVQHRIAKDHQALQIELDQTNLEALINASIRDHYFLNQALKDLPRITKLITNCRNARK